MPTLGILRFNSLVNISTIANIQYAVWVERRLYYPIALLYFLCTYSKHLINIIALLRKKRNFKTFPKSASAGRRRTPPQCTATERDPRFQIDLLFILNIPDYILYKFCNNDIFYKPEPRASGNLQHIIKFVFNLFTGKIFYWPTEKQNNLYYFLDKFNCFIITANNTVWEFCFGLLYKHFQTVITK
jgi:hypothetical protein